MSAVVVGLALVAGLGCGGDAPLPTDPAPGGDDGDGGSESSPSTRLITDLEPATYETDTLETEIRVYVDRDYTVEAPPPAFPRGTFVRTANDDKTAVEDSAVAFELTDTATVAVAYDERASQLPGWLDGWTATGEVVQTTDVDYDVFTRRFGPGAVVLGGNQSDGAEGAESMYLVLATRTASSPEDTQEDDDGDGDDGPRTGSVAVTTATSGDSIDADGYIVSVDDGSGRPMGVNDSITFSELPTGGHSIQLADIAAHCSASDANPRSVSVPESDTVSVGFDLECEAGTRPTIDAAVWARAEVVLQTDGVSGNPFEARVDAVFTHSGSGREIRMPGYYDGDDTWKVNFMPTRSGEWTYRTESPVAALDGATGTVSAVSSSDRGMLVADPTPPARWRFADGSYVLPIALRMEFFSEDGSLSAFEEAADVLAENNVHMMETRLLEEYGMFGGRHDFIFEGDWRDHRFDLEIWQRMERRMDALAERRLGAHIMFYSDDGGEPGWSGQSETERLVLRYAVARLAPYPVVVWNTGIDISEYRSDADIDWLGRQLAELDPYDHPRSSRRGGGSGGVVMNDENVHSWGGPNRAVLDAGGPDDILSRADAATLPISFDDAWGENRGSHPDKDHRPADIRRGGWKSLAAGGAGFLIRGGGDGLPRTGFYSIHRVESDWESEQWLSLLNPFLRNRLGSTFGAMDRAPELVSGTGMLALADPSRQRILYFSVGADDRYDDGGGDLTVALSGEVGTWDGRWFDPRDGSTSDAGSFEGGRDHTISPPSDDDWILLLTAD